MEAGVVMVMMMMMQSKFQKVKWKVEEEGHFTDPLIKPGL